MPSTVRRRDRPHRLPSFAAIAGVAGVLAAGLTATTCKRARAVARVGEQPPSSTPTSLPVRTTCGSTRVRATGTRQRNGEAGAASREADADHTWLVGLHLRNANPDTAADLVLRLALAVRPDQQRRRASPVWLLTQGERKPPSADRAVDRRLLDCSIPAVWSAPPLLLFRLQVPRTSLAVSCCAGPQGRESVASPWQTGRPLPPLPRVALIADGNDCTDSFRVWIRRRQRIR